MKALLESLRHAPWLTQERVVAYSWMALLSYAGCGVYLALTSHAGVNVWGKPVGGDFLCFWAAGALALQGHPTAAYDLATHIAEQARVIPGTPLSYFPWVYPPMFLLPMVALALLPYGASLFTWLALTGAAYVACLRRIAPHPHLLLVALAWPGVFDNVLSGQNGFLTAAVLGGGLLLLESRPFAAGALLALLSFKPQFALLVPIALLAGGQWRAIVGGVAGLAALIAATTVAFGTDIWPAFDASRRLAQGLLEGMHGAFYGKVGVFSAVRLLGGDVGLAWLVQWPVSIAMALLTAWAWRSKAPQHLKSAVLVAATPLATPWANIYDLVILAVPAAWLIADGVRSGFLPWERVAIVAAAVVPVASIGIASALGIQVVPLIEIAFVAVVAQRLRIAAAPAPT